MKTKIKSALIQSTLALAVLACALAASSCVTTTTTAPDGTVTSVSQPLPGSLEAATAAAVLIGTHHAPRGTVVNVEADSGK